jgi:hypothetical protein
LTSFPEQAPDGLNIAEVLAAFEADGFAGQFATRPGGRVLCYTCRQESPARDVGLERLWRTEGASDPADMVAVVALTCPLCGAGGTVALPYGPESDPDESEVLRHLEARAG